MLMQKNKKDEEDSNMISDIDLKHLRRCVELAKLALEKGDEPFGSVLVSANGEVLLKIITTWQAVTIPNILNLL